MIPLTQKNVTVSGGVTRVPKHLSITPTMIEDFLIDPVLGMYVIFGVKLDIFQAVAVRTMWWVPNVLDSSGFGTGKSFRIWLVSNLRAMLIGEQQIVAYYQDFQSTKDIYWANYPRFGSNQAPIFAAQLGRVDEEGLSEGKDNTKGSACYKQYFKNDSCIFGPAPNWLQGAIRAVAALHKNAEGVMKVIETWQAGKTPFGGTEWTVSMENEATISDGGFLLLRTKAESDGYYHPGNRLDEFAALGLTPDDFKALGWIYVPWGSAPEDLRGCLDAGGMVAVAKNFMQTATSPGVTTLFLNGGLNGRLFYFGVALTPLARESHARVGRVLASADGIVVALTAVGDAMTGFCEKILKKD